SGTPTTAGVFSYTVQATDTQGRVATKSCSIGILGVSCNNPPDGLVGLAYSHQLSFSGGFPPYFSFISAGALPPGLSLAPSTGFITGIPTTGGTFPFTVSLLDSRFQGIGTVNCSITISTPPQEIAGGMGCLPECFDYCAPVAVESMNDGGIGGDPGIVAGIVGALLLGS